VVRGVVGMTLGAVRMVGDLLVMAAFMVPGGLMMSAPTDGAPREAHTFAIDYIDFTYRKHLFE
jgi:hypothetical protein